MCIYIYIHTYIYICVHIYIYIYTCIYVTLHLHINAPQHVARRAPEPRFKAESHHLSVLCPRFDLVGCMSYTAVVYVLRVALAYGN